MYFAAETIQLNSTLFSDKRKSSRRFGNLFDALLLPNSFLRDRISKVYLDRDTSGEID